MRFLMKRSIPALILLFSLLFFYQCSEDETITSSSFVYSERSDLSYTILTDQLEIPWQMAFAPDGRMFITERKGVVKIFENGALQNELWLDLRDSLRTSSASTVPQSGLTGIALDPDFANNKYVYLGYSYEAPGEVYDFNKLVRYKENSETGVAEFDKILVDQIKGKTMHNSGQLKFGPDNKIYWTIGDLHQRESAQDLEDTSGSILRMNPDGSVPEDNPFPGSLIYAYGLRNSQGFGWHPENHAMVATEHGPTGQPLNDCCYDEINIIKSGSNYGWPLIQGDQQRAGMELPLLHSDSGTPTEEYTWAPSGAAFVHTGPWKNSFLFAGLRSQSLWQLVFRENEALVVEELNRYLLTDLGRIRTVDQHPDGTIYLLTSNLDGLSDQVPQKDYLIKLERPFPSE